MRYARDEWDQERLGWRTIVQLNIVRQALAIIQIISSEIARVYPVGNTRSEDERVVVDALQMWISRSNTTQPRHPFSLQQTNAAIERRSRIMRHQDLINRLLPQLSKVDEELKSRLASYEVYYSARRLFATPFGEEEGGIDDDVMIRKTINEYSIRSWRDVLDAAPKPPPNTTLATAAHGADSKSVSLSLDYIDTPTRIIAEVREDIKTLWTDEDVRSLIKERRLGIPDSIGLFVFNFFSLFSKANTFESDSDGESPFLNEIDRLARTDYEVSDHDIVRARLKTVGVQEYKFNFDTSSSSLAGKLWDVNSPWSPH